MPGFTSVIPNINVNTESAQLRTELLNTFNRLQGQLSLAPYRLFTQNGPAGNVGGGATTLFTSTINFGTLSKSGSSILIFACGKYAANGNSKTIDLVFGSTNILTSTTTTNNGSWTLQAEIVYNGGSAEIAWGQFFAPGTNPVPQVTLGTESLATNQVLKVVGTGVASNDISCYYWKGILLS